MSLDPKRQKYDRRTGYQHANDRRREPKSCIAGQLGRIQADICGYEVDDKKPRDIIELHGNDRHRRKHRIEEQQQDQQHLKIALGQTSNENIDERDK